MFITFEGIDYCGKSTQIDEVGEYLSNTKEVIISRNPGGTKIGQSIRKIILSPETENLSDTAEILLFMADRFQWIYEVLKPNKEKIVLCDRYMESSLAYQCGGRMMKLDFLQTLIDKVPKPDLVFYLKIPYDVSVQRMLGKNPDRMEQNKRDFFERTIAYYNQLAAENHQVFQV